MDPLVISVLVLVPFAYGRFMNNGLAAENSTINAENGHANCTWRTTTNKGPIHLYNVKCVPELSANNAVAETSPTGFEATTFSQELFPLGTFKATYFSPDVYMLSWSNLTESFTVSCQGCFTVPVGSLGDFKSICSSFSPCHVNVGRSTYTEDKSYGLNAEEPAIQADVGSNATCTWRARKSDATALYNVHCTLDLSPDKVIAKTGPKGFGTTMFSEELFPSRTFKAEYSSPDAYMLTWFNLTRSLTVTCQGCFTVPVGKHGGFKSVCTDLSPCRVNVGSPVHGDDINKNTSANKIKVGPAAAGGAIAFVLVLAGILWWKIRKPKGTVQQVPAREVSQADIPREVPHELQRICSLQDGRENPPHFSPNNASRSDAATKESNSLDST